MSLERLFFKIAAPLLSLVLVSPVPVNSSDCSRTVTYNSDTVSESGVLIVEERIEHSPNSNSESEENDNGSSSESSGNDVITPKEDISHSGGTDTTPNSNSSNGNTAGGNTGNQNTAGLTTEGNMNLVDDINQTGTESMEFLTVTTKSNHTFYIVIEKDKNANNVHFLNQVDERDLFELLSEEEQKEFTKQEKKEPVVTPTPEPVIIEEPKKETGNNNVFPFVIVGVAAAAAGGYYWFKIKPEKEAAEMDEDLDFEDDEDYVNEDEEDEE